MKKLLVLIALSGCVSNDMPDFKPPIVVLALNPETQLTYGSVVLRDSEGKTWSASGANNHAARAIINSYRTGDTLK